MKYFATRNADSRETETINDQVAFYKAKFTDEDIASISGVPKEKIQKRRMQR